MHKNRNDYTPAVRAAFFYKKSWWSKKYFFEVPGVLRWFVPEYGDLHVLVYNVGFSLKKG